MLMHKMLMHTMQSTIEHAILKFKIVVDECGYHIEHVFPLLDG